MSDPIALHAFCLKQGTPVNQAKCIGASMTVRSGTLQASIQIHCSIISEFCLEVSFLHRIMFLILRDG